MPERRLTRAWPIALSFGQRLYVRIYLAILGSLLLAAMMFGLAHWRFQYEQANSTLESLAVRAGRELAAPDAPRDQQRAALQNARRTLGVNLILYGADRAPIARAGPPLALPPTLTESGRLPNRPGVYAYRMDDGRWLLAQRARPPRPRPNLYLVTLLIALVVGVAAYPVVRRLTRRLERLQTSVERWGEGALSTRVAVEGGDEVARVAHSFNSAAGRIEALVGAQKTLLANASHELRSPLARIRMASELMGEQASPRLRAELNRNIEELDQIIEELLLASRLDAANGQAIVRAPLDITGLAAEECARAGASLTGSVAEMTGDAKLLRRLLRNLVENAQRYGGGSPVAVHLAEEGASVRIDVCDRGPGVPEAEREAIFEPFYRAQGASEAAGGVGLGLSLVRQIARHHGGEVVCLANPGGGCCMRVTLPQGPIDPVQTGLATIR